MMREKTTTVEEGKEANFIDKVVHISRVAKVVKGDADLALAQS